MRLTSPVAAMLVLVLGSLLAVNGFAGDAGNVAITGMWARATPPLATTGAAYMEIRALRIADKLLGATTPVAERVEIHTTANNNNVMQMRPLKTLAVVPGETTRLAPAGTHLMLVGLKAPLKAGGTFPLKLQFERAGEVTVPVEILMEAPVHEHLHP